MILHFSQSPSWPTQLKSVIIASPGFTKDGFYSYLQQVADSPSQQKGGSAGFLRHCLERSIVAHSSSGFKHSLTEVL